MDRELIYEELLSQLKRLRTSVDRNILLDHENELLIRISAYADAVAHNFIGPIEAKLRLEYYIDSLRTATEQSDSGIIKF